MQPGLAIAESSDNGGTWSKSTKNPILLGEPENIQVTGFRDPFLAEWPAMDRLFHQSSLYGLVSRGIEGQAQLLSYILCSQTTMPRRFQPSAKWSGNFGMNWECVNFLTLGSGQNNRTCLIIGAEGDMERDHIRNFKSRSQVPPRAVRSVVWMFGDLKSNNNLPSVTYTYGGYLDCGSLYAANSFFDPVSKRDIMYTWIPEEDIPAGHVNKNGWNGALAIPRELFLLTIENPDGLTTIYTLGIRPIQEISHLRRSCVHHHEWKNIPLSSTTQNLCSTTFPSWELQGVISVHPNHFQEVVLYIRHNDDMSIYTSVTFCLRNETIRVDREKSNNDPAVRNCPEEGPFTLFYTGDRTTSEQRESLENLHIHIISDGDVLEVYANDRFALATMVYSPELQESDWDISLWVWRSRERCSRRAERLGRAAKNGGH
ncbi:hypothetical protein PHISCL_05459 [Aspergillus sclerotialis]|uniref:Uncharacterized protein n=1 Tax=Aspergillus sclerotialis TaxID=2070753 RepID=A0A3A2ZYS9_9EURO|nr:hypothetical protein PHISCL_05459 [Aspergillus sclerotialis]